MDKLGIEMPLVLDLVLQNYQVDHSKIQHSRIQLGWKIIFRYILFLTSSSCSSPSSVDDISFLFLYMAVFFILVVSMG